MYSIEEILEMSKDVQENYASVQERMLFALINLKLTNNG